MATRADLSVGDLVAARVTKVLPYGFLVESLAGVPGMVTGARAKPGEDVRLEVTSVDVDNNRFSADLVR